MTDGVIQTHLVDPDARRVQYGFGHAIEAEFLFDLSSRRNSRTEASPSRVAMRQKCLTKMLRFQQQNAIGAKEPVATACEGSITSRSHSPSRSSRASMRRYSSRTCQASSCPSGVSPSARSLFSASVAAFVLARYCRQTRPIHEPANRSKDCRRTLPAAPCYKLAQLSGGLKACQINV